MKIIIKCNNTADGFEYIKSVANRFLAKHPDVDRITIDLTLKSLIEVYSKGNADKIIFKRSPKNV